MAWYVLDVSVLADDGATEEDIERRVERALEREFGRVVLRDVSEETD